MVVIYYERFDKHLMADDGGVSWSQWPKWCVEMLRKCGKKERVEIPGSLATRSIFDLSNAFLQLVHAAILNFQFVTDLLVTETFFFRENVEHAPTNEHFVPSLLNKSAYIFFFSLINIKPRTSFDIRTVFSKPNVVRFLFREGVEEKFYRWWGPLNCFFSPGGRSNQQDVEINCSKPSPEHLHRTKNYDYEIFVFGEN